MRLRSTISLEMALTLVYESNINSEKYFKMDNKKIGKPMQAGTLKRFGGAVIIREKQSNKYKYKPHHSLYFVPTSIFLFTHTIPHAHLQMLEFCLTLVNLSQHTIDLDVDLFDLLRQSTLAGEEIRELAIDLAQLQNGSKSEGNRTNNNDDKRTRTVGKWVTSTCTTTKVMRQIRRKFANGKNLICGARGKTNDQGTNS